MEILETITRTHPFLEGMPAQFLALLVKDAVIAEFEKDEVILREGDYADKFYLIHHGKVALESHTFGKNLPIETLGAGDVLGWSWLFPPFSWHFQARALEPTIVLQINGPRLLIASEENDKFGHELMKRLAQVVIHRLQKTRKRLIEATNKAEVELGSVL